MSRILLPVRVSSAPLLSKLTKVELNQSFLTENTPSLKQVYIYSAFAILIMRGVLEYTERRSTNEFERLQEVSNKLVHKADSLAALEALSEDSLVAEGLRRDQRPLLAVALAKKKEAIRINEDQIWLIDQFILLTNVLLGVIVAAFIVLSLKIWK